MGPKEMTIDPEEFERELTNALTSSDELNQRPAAQEPAPLINLGTGQPPTPTPTPTPTAGSARVQSSASDGLTDGLGELSSLGSSNSNSSAAEAARQAARPTSNEFSPFVGASAGTALGAARAGLASASAIMGSLVDLSSAGVGDGVAGGAVAPGSGGAGPGSPGTPGIFGEHTEVLHALHEPVVSKFLACSVEDLQMGDIPVLLADYKRIAGLQGKLQQFFKQQGFEFNAANT